MQLIYTKTTVIRLKKNKAHHRALNATLLPSHYADPKKGSISAISLPTTKVHKIIYSTKFINKFA